MSAQNTGCLFHATYASKNRSSSEWSASLRRPKSPPPTGTVSRLPTQTTLLRKDYKRGQRFRSLALQGAEKYRLLQQREQLEAQQESLRREKALEQRRQTQKQLCERFLRAPLRLLAHLPARASVTPRKPILRTTEETGSSDKSLRLHVRFDGEPLSPTFSNGNGCVQVERPESLTDSLSPEPPITRPSWLEQQVAKRRTWNLLPQVAESPKSDHSFARAPVYFEIEPPRHDSSILSDKSGTKELYSGWSSFPGCLKRNFAQRRTQSSVKKLERGAVAIVKSRPIERRNRVYPMNSAGLPGADMMAANKMKVVAREDGCRGAETYQDGWGAIVLGDRGGRSSSTGGAVIRNALRCMATTPSSHPAEETNCCHHDEEIRPENHPNRKESTGQDSVGNNAPEVAKDELEDQPKSLPSSQMISATKLDIANVGAVSPEDSEAIDPPVTSRGEGVNADTIGKETHDLTAPTAQSTQNPELISYQLATSPEQRSSSPLLDGAEREIAQEAMVRVAETSILASWPFSVPEDGSTTETLTKLAQNCARVSSHTFSDSDSSYDNKLRKDEASELGFSNSVTQDLDESSLAVISASGTPSTTPLVNHTPTEPLVVPQKAIKDTLNQQLRSHRCRETSEVRQSLPQFLLLQEEQFDGAEKEAREEQEGAEEDEESSQFSIPIQGVPAAARGEQDGRVHRKDSNLHRCIHQAVLNRLLPASLVTGLADLEQLRRRLRAWRKSGSIQVSTET